MHLLYTLITFSFLKFFKFYGLWALVESHIFYKDKNVHGRLIMRGHSIFKISLWWEWLAYVAILWFSVGNAITTPIIILFALFFVRLVLILMRIKGYLPIENLMLEKRAKDLGLVVLMVIYDLAELATLWGIYYYFKAL